MTTTFDELLDLALDRFMDRGYHSVTFGELAEVVGISKAAVHHHFRTKEELGLKTIERYSQNTLSALTEIDGLHSRAYDKLSAYVQIDRQMVERKRVCLCGMFHSEFSTLPQSMQDSAGDLRTAICHWLEAVFSLGSLDGSLNNLSAAEDEAALFFTTLEGVMLIARPNCDLELFGRITDRLLRNYKTD